MRKPTTNFTTLLTKGARMTEDVGSQVACCFTLFPLNLILYKASTAPTGSCKGLTASLQIELPANGRADRIREPGSEAVPAKKGIPK
jgi:hypothetical protein